MIEPLILPGTLDSLDDVRKYVTQVAASAGIDKHAAYRLTLAVDEIASNSVLHGYEEQGLKGTLTLSSEVNETQVNIILEDEGKMYDPLQAAEPLDLKELPENRNIGGWGIYLAINGVDEFRYVWVNNRNRYNFIVKRRPAVS